MDNISAVKEKLPIETLIGAYVPLKRAGKNYKGNCPFHQEKTPSFIVSPDIQRYRCFGCGKTGDIFNFIEEYEGVDFSESLKILAEKAGVELKAEKNPQYQKEKDRNEHILKINKLVAQFYAYMLHKHKVGQIARDYLKKRNLTEKTAKEFLIGYAPNSWDATSNFLVKNKFSFEDIFVSGIGKYRKSSQNTYDIFRGRLIFPLVDHMDRVAGFSARALMPDQEPKYINTPETPIFHKEKFLFGINLSKKYIREKNEAIIVEGVIDMISLYQNDYKNVVGSQGTALTIGQINLLKRYCENVVLIFDSDPAGIEASIRAIKVIQNSDLNIKIGIIKDGAKDPDELMQKDPKKFQTVLNESMPLWDYYFYYVAKKYKLENIFEKRKASEFILNALSEITDSVVKAKYVKKYSDLFDVDEKSALSEIEKIKKNGPVEKMAEDGGLAIPQEKISNPEVYLLGLLLNTDKDSLEVYLKTLEIGYFSDERARIIYDQLCQSINDKNYEIKRFYDKLTASYPNTISLFERIYLLDLSSIVSDLSVLTKEISVTIKRLKKEFHMKELKLISKAIKKAEVLNDSAKIEELLSKADLHRAELKNLSD